MDCYANGYYDESFGSFAGNRPMTEVDPDMHALLVAEKSRQFTGIELIASENFASRAVIEALGSCATNKYSEGYPGARYYGGNEVIDKIEQLVIDRALECYRLDPAKWGVNVQPYSGSSANFELYTALLNPHDRIMGLDLPSGGHLTHGFYTAKKKVSATSIYFESLPYSVDAKTGYIDYDNLETLATLFRPKLLICGASAYPRDLDYPRLRAIADKVGAILHCDMAHVSGLVAAQELQNPFELCDIVTSTTHKTLRGPRQGLIFYRRGPRPAAAGDKAAAPEDYDYEDRIKQAVFPGCQGGPHNNTIAALGVALKEAMTPEFKAYVVQMKANCAALADFLVAKGYALQTGGTENHLLLWDLRPLGVSGNKMEKICDAAHVTLNKNAVAGDLSAWNPGGCRIGAAAMTSRGLKEADFVQVGEFLIRLVELADKIQKSCGSKAIGPFVEAMESDEELKGIKKEVVEFSAKFPMPGGWF